METMNIERPSKTVDDKSSASIAVVRLVTLLNV